VNPLSNAFGNFRRRMAEGGRRWFLKRQGMDDLDVVLHRRRIYILPTRSGLMYAAVLFILLLGSLNYANNIGFILTFLLSAVGIVAMHHCHRNLTGLQIAFVTSDPVFAKQSARVEFTLTSSHDRWQVEAGWDTDTQVSVDTDGHVRIRLNLPVTERGWITCPRIGLSTTYPLGLFRAWAWVYMDLHTLVYPEPSDYQAELTAADHDTQSSGLAGQGDDEFSELREYRPGDPVKRIAWKSVASTGSLLVKEYREGGQAPRWIDWDHIKQNGTENKLSAMCRLALNADQKQNVYGLRLPDVIVPPSRGKQHLHQCLRELALFGHSASHTGQETQATRQ